MSTLATVSLPANSPASSSSAGPIILQGPHHSAQKSTSTGPVLLASTTSVAKLLSVTGTVFALIVEILGKFQLRERWDRRPTRSSRVPCMPGLIRIEHLGRQDRHPSLPRPDQSTLHASTGKNHAQHRSVGRHLAQIQLRRVLHPNRRPPVGLEVGNQHAV